MKENLPGSLSIWTLFNFLAGSSIISPGIYHFSATHKTNPFEEKINQQTTEFHRDDLLIIFIFVKKSRSFFFLFGLAICLKTLTKLNTKSWLIQLQMNEKKKRRKRVSEIL